MSHPVFAPGSGAASSFAKMREAGPHSHDGGGGGEHTHPHDHPDLDELIDDHADHLTDHAGRLDDHDGQLAAIHAKLRGDGDQLTVARDDDGDG